MNAPDNMYLPDVQASADRRNLAIQRVGVKSLAHPVMVATVRGPQPSVASIDMYVGLPAHQKGTHMSRFIDVLQTHQQPLAMNAATTLLDRMLARLDATTGMIEFRLPFFVLKTAPVSGVESLMDYQLTLLAERTDSGTRFVQKVVVPVTSLCPCSKEISDYGAPEFNPQQWKLDGVHLAAMQSHYDAGARFISPYYFSVIPSRFKGGTEHGVNRMELGPDNTKDGSDRFYRAIIEFAKQ